MTAAAPSNMTAAAPSNMTAAAPSNMTAAAPSNMTAAAPSTNSTVPLVQPMNITKIPIIQKNQTGNQTTTAQNYNSTDTMMSSFKSGNKLLK
jgi:hypothetical protein